ncbi:MAG TPA: response regulator transcription factor [Opitutaceae bacterium]|nr:response regulator transcription factor [Opitutaceae bacterium]
MKSAPSLLENDPTESRRRPANKEHGIFVVEDHPITQAGLAALVNREPDLYICGDSDSATGALDLIAKSKPSGVISDISLKTSNGLELLKNLSTLCPNIPVLVISMHDEMLYAERAIRAGSRGYLMKHEAADKIIPAIRTILAGDIYLSEPMKGKLLSGLVRNRKSGGEEKSALPLETLSDRELEVFQLIGNGFTTREIAQRLHLSTKTIDSYREHLKTKLAVENGAELARRAICWTRVENIVET